MRRLRNKPVVVEAAERVSVVTVLQWMGVEIDAVPEPGGNTRVICPFTDLNHSSDVRDMRQMRVYSDNRAYCHECQRQYDAVSLAAMYWGCGFRAAAQRLLDGLEAVSQGVDLRAAPLSTLRANLAAALAVWADVRDVSRVSDRYGWWLSRLDVVVSDADAQEWLTEAKKELIKFTP